MRSWRRVADPSWGKDRYGKSDLFGLGKKGLYLGGYQTSLTQARFSKNAYNAVADFQ